MTNRSIPQGNNERITWGNNFANQFPAVAASLGFTPAETEAAVNDALMMVFVIENAMVNNSFSKASHAYKQDILGGVAEGISTPEVPALKPVAPPILTEAGVLGRLQIVCARIKAHQNYTDAIGELLMIATSETDGGSLPEDAKPTGSGEALNFSKVRIDWVKGKFDGVIIESQRGDEIDWTRLDRDFRSPFDDERPPLVAGKPEERRYRLMYFIDNEPVGDWSDVIVVITKP